ncbi:30S ribosomal protein S19e [Candidatus Woesearchaeota archaeon]|nr:30S ribosomal protein S19e [Candidatus Woesearchaeota archaeon]
MATMFDVPVNELLNEVAKELKNVPEIKPPVWSLFAKTGMHKERPPVQADWWYIRSASVLRKVRTRGPIGVSKLCTQYGGKQNRGHKPERFQKGSGSVARKVLQQLEKAGLVKKTQVGKHFGRAITPKGISLLDKTAGKLYKVNPALKQPTESAQQAAPHAEQK